MDTRRGEDRLASHIKERRESNGAGRSRGDREFATGGPVNERTWVADWYVPFGSHEHVCQQLDGRPTGAFLIRNDKGNQSATGGGDGDSKGAWMLSFRYQGQTHHVPIEQDEMGIRVQGSDWHFGRLSDLVFYYSDPRQSEHHDLPCTLLVAGRSEIDPRRKPVVPAKQRKTFALKEVDGELRIFDVATGEEVREITTALMSDVRAAVRRQSAGPGSSSSNAYEDLPAALPRGRRVIRRYYEDDMPAPSPMSTSRGGAFVGPQGSSSSRRVTHRIVDRSVGAGGRAPGSRPLWLQLGVPSRAALRLLVGRPDGAFVIRDGPSPDCLILSYVLRAAIHEMYILVPYDPPGVYLEIAPNKLFRNLDDLVDHYAAAPRQELQVALLPDALYEGDYVTSGSSGSGGGRLNTQYATSSSRAIVRSEAPPPRRQLQQSSGQYSQLSRRVQVGGSQFQQQQQQQQRQGEPLYADAQQGGSSTYSSVPPDGRVALRRRESDPNGEHLTLENQHLVSELILHSQPWTRRAPGSMPPPGEAFPILPPAPHRVPTEGEDRFDQAEYRPQEQQEQQQQQQRPQQGSGAGPLPSGRGPSSAGAAGAPPPLPPRILESDIAAGNITVPPPRRAPSQMDDPSLGGAAAGNTAASQRSRTAGGMIPPPGQGGAGPSSDFSHAQFQPWGAGDTGAQRGGPRSASYHDLAERAGGVVGDPGYVAGEYVDADGYPLGPEGGRTEDDPLQRQPSRTSESTFRTADYFPSNPSSFHSSAGQRRLSQQHMAADDEFGGPGYAGGPSLPPGATAYNSTTVTTTTTATASAPFNGVSDRRPPAGPLRASDLHQQSNAMGGNTGGPGAVTSSSSDEQRRLSSMAGSYPSVNTITQSNSQRSFTTSRATSSFQSNAEPRQRLQGRTDRDFEEDEGEEVVEMGPGASHAPVSGGAVSHAAALPPPPPPPSVGRDQRHSQTIEGQVSAHGFAVPPAIPTFATTAGTQLSAGENAALAAARRASSSAVAGIGSLPPPPPPPTVRANTSTSGLNAGTLAGLTTGTTVSGANVKSGTTTLVSPPASFTAATTNVGNSFNNAAATATTTTTTTATILAHNASNSATNATNSASSAVNNSMDSARAATAAALSTANSESAVTVSSAESFAAPPFPPPPAFRPPVAPGTGSRPASLIVGDTDLPPSPLRGVGSGKSLNQPPSFQNLVPGLQRTDSSASAPSMSDGQETQHTWMRVGESLSMEEVKAELTKAADGEFVVHDMDNSFAALTMKYRHKCLTWRIVRIQGRLGLEGSENTFDNLAALVEYYRDPGQTDLPMPLARMRNTDL